MKKTSTSILVFGIFLISYFVQSNFFNWFTIANVMPNLFVIIIIIIGLFAGKNTGLIFGLVFGILLDFFIGRYIGLNCVMLAGIGYLAGRVNSYFSKDNRLILTVATFLGTIVFEIGVCILSIIIFKQSIEIFTFTKILILEAFYNAILVIILFNLIVKFGFYLEYIFDSSVNRMMQHRLY